MSEQALAPMQTWLVAPMDDEVSRVIRRLRRAPDVQRIAVMPDVHLAEDVCVGVAVGTTDLLYPQAVGGDIGCGMLAIPFEIEAASISEPRLAGRILAQLGAEALAELHGQAPMGSYRPQCRGCLHLEQ